MSLPVPGDWLHQTVTATLLSPGAALQAAAVRHGFRWRMSAAFLDRFDGVRRQYERSFLRPSVRLTENGDLRVLEAPAFRFLLRQDGRGCYFSGSLENAAGESILWDIRLRSVLESGGLRLYQAEGKAMLADREALFPPASSFLVLQSGELPSAAGFRQKAAAWAASDAGRWVSPGIRLTAERVQALDDQIIMEAKGRSYPFRFRPDGAEAGFTVSLPGHRKAVTRLGAWTPEPFLSDAVIPGYFTSVIEL